VHWTPRLICILAILMISMLAADAFAPGLTIWQALAGFFIHLIPSIILTGLLIVAWKWELLGGLIFVLLGLGFTPFIFNHNFNMNHSVGMSMGIVLMVTFPFVVSGILFIVSHYLKRRNLVA
jgi:hypothetical protein